MTNKKTNIKPVKGSRSKKCFTGAPIHDDHRFGDKNSYQSLFENNHAPMLLIDPGTAEIFDANPAACRHYGWSKNEFKTKRITEINQLTDKEVFAEMGRAKKQKRGYFRFRHKIASGEIRDVEVYSGPIEVSGRKLLYSIIHDITERLKTEQALLESESRYRTLFETMNQGVIYQGADGTPLGANPAAEKILGLTFKEICERQKKGEFGQIFDENGNEIEPEMHPAAIALRTGKAVRNKIIRIIFSDSDEERWFSVDAIPQFRQGEKKPYQVYNCFSDITSRMKFEKDLQIANEKLELEQRSLREKNTALREVLGQIEEEKDRMAIQIKSNIDRIVIPVLKKLRERTGSEGKIYLSMLQESLSEITSPFINKLETQFAGLTPREVEICNMIKNGMDTKEIAASLHTSRETVRSQRKSIRRKLKLINNKINLNSYLKSF